MQHRTNAEKRTNQEDQYDGHCAKILYGCISSLFLLFGLIFLVLGSLVSFVPGKVFDKAYDSVMSKYNVSAGYSLPSSAAEIQNMPMIFEIGLAIFFCGLFLLILSLMACSALCCPCCSYQLIIFAIIMILLMIGEILLVTMYFEKASPLHEKIKTNIKKRITEEYNENGKDIFSKTMNLVQRYLACCGVDGPSDHKTRPKSCPPVIDIGCYTQSRNVVQKYSIPIGACIFVLAFLQLTQVVTACVIFHVQNSVPGPK